MRTPCSWRLKVQVEPRISHNCIAWSASSRSRLAADVPVELKIVKAIAKTLQSVENAYQMQNPAPARRL
jgi:hypothetical protein